MGKILEVYNRIFIGFLGEFHFESDGSALARRAGDPDPGIHERRPLIYPGYPIPGRWPCRLETAAIVAKIVDSFLEYQLDILHAFGLEKGRAG